MALHWNVEQIKNYKTVCWIDGEDEGEAGDGRRMNPVTEALIFGTMSVGLGQITDKNVDEFSARFRILERIHGAFLYKMEDGERKDWLLADEDFIAHIGLGTNVGDESRTAWARRLFVNKNTSETEQHARSFRVNRKKATQRVEA